MKKGLLFLMMALVTVCSVNATTYYYVGGTPGTQVWNTSTTAWSTIGVGGAATGVAVTPAAADIFIFDGSDVSSAVGLQTGNVTIVFGSAATMDVGQLILQNGANVTTSASGTRTLNVNGLAGTDLSIPTGCTLSTSGSTTNFAILTGATGSVVGNVNLGTGANGNTFTAVDAGALVFASGSVFTQNGTGSCFGTTGTQNTVVFQSGSTFTQTLGANPFGLGQPNSKVNFQTGSTFNYNQNAAPGFSGRTYANLVINNAALNQSPTGTALLTVDNLTMTAGTLNINLTGGISIKGNIAVNGGTLTFTPASASNVTFNGTTAQTISKTGTLTFAANANLVIANTASTVTFNTAQTVSGSMTVNSGATLATSATLTLAGTPAINGSFRINQGGFATGGTWNYGSTGTLVFNNSAGFYGVNNDAYWPAASGPVNVTVQNTGGVQMNVSRTVSGIFQTSTGVQGSALTLNGTNQINAGGFFNTTPIYGGSSTLIYNSASNYGRGNELTTGSGIPSNITVNAGSGLDYGNGATGTARTIIGNLTANGGFFMDFGANDMTQALTVNGNVVIGTAGTVSLSDVAGGDIKVGGNWTITGSGAFNPKARAVFFVNTGTSTITAPSVAAFDFLIIDKTGGGSAVLASNATVNNTLTLTTGNLSIASNTLTLNSTVSRTSGNLAGSDNSNLTIAGTAGSLFFDAAGTNNYLKNFTVNNSSSATLGNALNITGGASAGNEGTLTVSGSGVLTTGGFLAIKSNVNGTGRIAAGNTAGGYISGNVSVERYIRQNASKGWRLLASNTTGQNINAAWQEGGIGGMVNPNPGFGIKITKAGVSEAAVQALGFDTLSPGTSLFKYNPATDGLETVPNTNATGIATEAGYFIFIRGDRSPGQFGAGAPTTSTVLRSAGSLFLGDQTAVSTGVPGYALVRNPYPSRIDMRQIVRTGLLIDAYQVWDPKLGGAYGVGAYQTFTKSGADYIVTPGGGSYGSNGSVQNFIESGAAFFIQSSGGTGAAQVVEAAKASASSNASFRPATPLAGEARLSFNLSANNGGSIDAVDGGLVFFSNDYINEVDINDVRKSTNFNENFGLVRNNIELVVERRALINNTDTLFFKISNMKQLPYRLDIEATDIDPVITTAILEDRFTNTNTTLDLAVPNSYDFTIDATAASRAADRFRIVFRQSSVVPVSFVSVKAAQSGNNISVEWKVANEINTVRYEVEKSTDGRSFTKKGTVSAVGISTYNWLDENVSTGYNYYRIKSVDNNGQVKYTQIVKVQFGGKAGISVSPNPVQGNFVNIQFNSQQAGKYGVRITNIAGQAVYNRQVQHNGGSSSQSFVLPSALLIGVYQLEVIAPDNSKHTEKLIINQGN